MTIRNTIALGLALAGLAFCQAEALERKMSTLRSLAENERGRATKELALSIRALASVEEKLALAANLSNLATEGDNGKDALQALADTLTQAIRQAGARANITGPAAQGLARLVRYEGVTTNLDNAQYKAAYKEYEQIDKERQAATFSLRDLTGKQWSLKDLRGKVVLVNFWATWCPPCRKEMPDLNALHKRFQGQGLVVLAISDEEEPVVRKFLSENPYDFPIIVDHSEATNKAFRVEGIPKSLVYNRAGEIVATAEDQRTEKQFLEMLGKAGLK
jgi:peroxiredoxin